MRTMVNPVARTWSEPLLVVELAGNVVFSDQARNDDVAAAATELTG
jgi:hypothetical protein